MTDREQAAFAAGIKTARQMALIAAMTIESRDGAGIVRDQAAMAAPQGLVEGLKVFFLNSQPALSASHADTDRCGHPWAPRFPWRRRASGIAVSRSPLAAGTGSWPASEHSILGSAGKARADGPVSSWG